MLEKPDFASGSATTHFIESQFGADGFSEPRLQAEHAALAAVLQYCRRRSESHGRTVRVAAPLLNWSSGGQLATPFEYADGDATIELLVRPAGATSYLVTVKDSTVRIDVLAETGANIRVSVNGRIRNVNARHSTFEKLQLAVDGQTLTFFDLVGRGADDVEKAGNGRILAPMHGKIADVLVAVGDQIAKGQQLVVLEAMKMEHAIEADVSGVVEQIGTRGSQIGAGDLLVRIKPDESDDS